LQLARTAKNKTATEREGRYHSSSFIALQRSPIYIAKYDIASSASAGASGVPFFFVLPRRRCSLQQQQSFSSQRCCDPWENRGGERKGDAKKWNGWAKRSLGGSGTGRECEGISRCTARGEGRSARRAVLAEIRRWP